MYKMKSFNDYDATVVAIVPGEGRHFGRMGAITCQMPNCTWTFNIGTGFTDTQRENPPAIGSIVKFKCMEFTNAGVPRFPVFLGERIE